MAANKEYLKGSEVAEKLRPGRFSALDETFKSKLELVNQYSQDIDVEKTINYAGKEFINNEDITRRLYKIFIEKDTGVQQVVVKINGDIQPWNSSGYVAGYNGDTVSWEVTTAPGKELISGMGLPAATGSKIITKDETLTFITTGTPYRLTINVPANATVKVDGTIYDETTTITTYYGKVYNWEAIPDKWYEINGTKSGSITITSDYAINPGTPQKIMASLTGENALALGEFHVYVNKKSVGKLIEGEGVQDLGSQWLGDKIEWSTEVLSGWICDDVAASYDGRIGNLSSWEGEIGELLEAYNKTTAGMYWGSGKPHVYPYAISVNNNLTIKFPPTGVESFTIRIQSPHTPTLNGNEKTVTVTPTNNTITGIQWMSVVYFEDIKVTTGYSAPTFSKTTPLFTMPKGTYTYNIPSVDINQHTVTFQFGEGVKPTEADEFVVRYEVTGKSGFNNWDAFLEETHSVYVNHDETISWMPQIYGHDGTHDSGRLELGTRYLWNDMKDDPQSESLRITEDTVIIVDDFDKYRYGISSSYKPWDTRRKIYVEVKGLPNNNVGGIKNDASDISTNGWWVPAVGTPSINSSDIIEVTGYDSSYEFYFKDGNVYKAPEDYKDLVLVIEYTKKGNEECKVIFDSMQVPAFGKLYYGILDEGFDMDMPILPRLNKTMPDGQEWIMVPKNKVLVWCFLEADKQYHSMHPDYEYYTKFFCSPEYHSETADDLKNYYEGQVKKITSDYTYTGLYTEKHPLKISNKAVINAIPVTVQCLTSGISNANEVDSTNISVGSTAKTLYYTEGSTIKLSVTDGGSYKFNPSDSITIDFGGNNVDITANMVTKNVYPYKFVWDPEAVGRKCVIINTDDIIVYEMKDGESGGNPATIDHLSDAYSDTLQWFMTNKSSRLNWSGEIEGINHLQSTRINRAPMLSDSYATIINLAEWATNNKDYGASTQYQKIKVRILGNPDGEVTIKSVEGSTKLYDNDIAYVSTLNWGDNPKESDIVPKSLSGYTTEISITPNYDALGNTAIGSRSWFYPDYDVTITYVPDEYHLVKFDLSNKYAFEAICVKFGDWSGDPLDACRDIVLNALNGVQPELLVKSGERVTFGYIPRNDKFHALDEMANGADASKITSSTMMYGHTSNIINTNRTFSMRGASGCYFNVEMNNIESAKIEWFDPSENAEKSKTITSDEYNVYSAYGYTVKVSSIVPKSGYEWTGDATERFDLMPKNESDEETIYLSATEKEPEYVNVKFECGEGIRQIYLSKNGSLRRYSYAPKNGAVYLSDVILGTDIIWEAQPEEYYRFINPDEYNGVTTIDSNNQVIEVESAQPYATVRVELDGYVNDFKWGINGVVQPLPVIARGLQQLYCQYPSDSNVIGVDIIKDDRYVISIHDVNCLALRQVDNNRSYLGSINITEKKEYLLKIITESTIGLDHQGVANNIYIFEWQPPTGIIAPKLTQLEEELVVAKDDTASFGFDGNNYAHAIWINGYNQTKKNPVNWVPFNNQRLFWGLSSKTNTINFFYNESGQSSKVVKINLADYAFSQSAIAQYSKVNVKIQGNDQGSCTINGKVLYDGESTYIQSNKTLNVSDINVTKIDGYKSVVAVKEFYADMYDPQSFAPDWDVTITYSVEEIDYVPLTLELPMQTHPQIQVLYKINADGNVYLDVDYDGVCTIPNGSKSTSIMVPRGSYITLGTDASTQDIATQSFKMDAFTGALFKQGAFGATTRVYVTGATTKLINCYWYSNIKVDLVNIKSANVTYLDAEELTTKTSNISATTTFNNAAWGPDTFIVNTIVPASKYVYEGDDPIYFKAWDLNEPLTKTISVEGKIDLINNGGILKPEYFKVEWTNVDEGINNISCNYCGKISTVRANIDGKWILDGLIGRNEALKYEYVPNKYYTISSGKTGTLLINEDKTIQAPASTPIADVNITCNGLIKSMTVYVNGKVKQNVTGLQGIDKYDVTSLTVPCNVEIRNVECIDKYTLSSGSQTTLNINSKGQYYMTLKAEQITPKYKHTVKYDNGIASVTVNGSVRGNGSEMSYDVGTALNIVVTPKSGYLVANNRGSSFSQSITLNSNTVSEYSSVSTSGNLTDPTDKLRCDLIMERYWDNLVSPVPTKRSHLYKCHFLLRNVSDSDLSNLNLLENMSPEYLRIKYAIKNPDSGVITRNNSVVNGDALIYSGWTGLENIGGATLTTWSSANMPAAHQEVKTNEFWMAMDEDIDTETGPINPGVNKDDVRVVSNYNTYYESIFSSFPWPTGRTEEKGIIEII